jgi:hypothetical protein
VIVGLVALAAGLVGPAAGSAQSKGEAPAVDPLAVLPRLGAETYDSNPGIFAGIAEATSGGYARLHVLWSQVEPNNTTPDNFDWSWYDYLFGMARTNGAQVLVTIVGCPAWACPSANGPINAGLYTEVGQFAGALAARYKQPPYDIHAYELWNEPDATEGPNRQNGWGNHPDKYAMMLSYAYPAIKANDSQAAVMLGGIAYGNFIDEGGTFNRSFLPDLLAAGGGAHIDAVAFHYYSHASIFATIADKAAQIRSVVEAAGVSLPLVCTETGLTSDPAFGSSEAIQARYTVKLHSWAASAGLRSVTWFLYRDYTSPDPGQAIFTKTGLIRIDQTKKPSFYAMRTFSQIVGSSAYLRPLGELDGVTPALEGYRFLHSPGTDATRQVSVIWSRDGGAVEYAIPASQTAYLQGVKSLMGQPVDPAPGPNGTLVVSVGADPVYVEWLAPHYLDVPFDSWAYPYVDYLAAREIIGGYADGTFRPGNPATRGQFSKMAALGAGWTLLDPASPTFADVPRGSTFYRYVETAYSRSVIQGYPCGGPNEPCDGQNRPYFRPGSNITRGQIAKIIVLAEGWTPLNPPEATFADIAPGSTFYQYIETAAARGIVSGYACGGPNEPCDGQNRSYFRPGNNATRAQLSKMLALALQQP